MAEEKVEVRDINFRQVLPWTELFRGFQVALDPKKLLLAAAGILATAVLWWIWGIVFYTQARPKWESHEYKDIATRSAREGENPDEASKRWTNEAWKQFKDDRRKWDILHG